MYIISTDRKINTPKVGKLLIKGARLDPFVKGVGLKIKHLNMWLSTVKPLN